MKMTEWFPINVKPVRNGVYQTILGLREADNPPYQRYEDGEWFSTCETAQEAEDCPFVSAISDLLHAWRGLTEKPE
ncbi:hypothetical protein AWB73_00092 [Caballeronia turbans]|nr:hypothetical protein AWB73_00092 [Caballeronia turbans]